MFAFLWITLITLTVLNLIWLIVQISNDGETIGLSLFALTVVVGLIGWGAFGSLTNTSFKKEKFEYLELTKGKSFILLTDYDKYYIFDTKFDMDNISDTTTFYREIGINMYGGSAEYDELFYYTYQDTIFKLNTFEVVDRIKEHKAIKIK